MALKGIKVVEMAGLAPSPLCGMILSDLGASVIRVDRTGASFSPDIMTRGKRSLSLNLKTAEGSRVLSKLCSTSDVLIEPFRAGVMEKLGLGPQTLYKKNPGLIYARLTGFGQEGPLAKAAGHDINYLAISGILSRLGRKDAVPTPPINILADFAGGGLMAAFGIMAALYERSSSGKGQIIDANMVEGAAYVSSWIYMAQNMSPIFGKARGENVLDSGAHFYDTYRTKDDKHMAVGAIEPQFYQLFLKGLGMSADELPQFTHDPEGFKKKVADKFASKTRQEWEDIFADTDACVTPVLELNEAAQHEHNVQRKAFFQDNNGTMTPIPAPRLSRTPATPQIGPELQIGQHSLEILAELEYCDEEINKMADDGVIQVPKKQAKL